ncbi:Mor transcription activator family protein [Desulfovibrio piger]|nr:Mor transcription activator family protein [Desulfovibrio piger]
MENDFWRTLKGILEKNGVSQKKTAYIIRDFWREWQGEQVYVRLRCNIVQRLIYLDFNGKNISELIKKYHFSRAEIYKKLKRERERLRK